MIGKTQRPLRFIIKANIPLAYRMPRVILKNNSENGIGNVVI